MSFSSAAILEILNNLDEIEVVSALPYRPKGGELYCFKGDGVKAQDWRADGHRWVNQETVGLPRKNPTLKKKYFYIATENGASKDFVKFVFHQPSKENGPFIIQYIGDESVSLPHAHGNSKNTEKPFIRTKPSALDKWLQQTKSDDPNAVYKKEVREEEMPRYLKQIQNLRYKGNNEMRISRDACVSDGEIGIINAMSCITTLVDVRCWNHILQDCQRWLSDHGCGKEEIKCYKDHLRFIFSQSSKVSSLEAIEGLKQAWENDFTKYFDDRILPNLSKVAKWAISNLTTFDPYSGITQNQSESMNKLLKSLNKWKESPVDVVILSFLRLHQYYLKEISRGRAGLGNYTLKPQYVSARIDLSEVIRFAVCSPEDIVNSIRENQFITEKTEEQPEKKSTTVDIIFSRADELIQNDRKPRVDKVFPESCSCWVGNCYHLIAVKKKSLGMEVRQKAPNNLAALRAKDKKKKAGRKRPREGDFDYEIIKEKSVTEKSKNTVTEIDIKCETQSVIEAEEVGE